MIKTPSLFRHPHPFPYPKNNKQCFEEWFSGNYAGDWDGKRKYIPVFWTGYHVRHKFGQEPEFIEILQMFIDSLSKDEKYFTIVQYDNGTLVDMSGIDAKVFAMSGNRIDYCLPLIYQMPTVNFSSHKDIFCNFIGRLTHPCRNDIMSFKQREFKQKYYISDIDHSPSQFCHILARSTFTLAPRGYGQTSFRILEAVAQGSIPVYISDEHLIPHGVPFSEYGVLVNTKDTLYIPEILEAITTEEIEQKRSRLKEIYYTYYTYEANRDLILKNI